MVFLGKSVYTEKIAGWGDCLKDYTGTQTVLSVGVPVFCFREMRGYSFGSPASDSVADVADGAGVSRKQKPLCGVNWTIFLSEAISFCPVLML